MTELDHTGMDEWVRLASEEVGQDSLSCLRWQTPEGIEVKALYTAAVSYTHLRAHETLR